MAVRTEKNGAVWTIIHDRPEARNAMDPKSADALTAAFLEFDADKNASVAVFYGAGGAFCAGWDLKFVSTLNSEYPLGELDIPPAGPRGIGCAVDRRWNRPATTYRWPGSSARNHPHRTQSAGGRMPKHRFV
jgi:enoyl-CoA hydratase